MTTTCTIDDIAGAVLATARDATANERIGILVHLLEIRKEDLQ